MVHKFQCLILSMVYFGLFGVINCNDEAESNFKLSQLADIAANLQQTPQNTFGNAPYFGHHQSYNYLTPASTYKTFSAPPPEHHTSQTAPLALSLHPDDYKNFDKTEQTFFIPRTRNIANLGNGFKSQQEFYVPRSNLKQSVTSLLNIPHGAQTSTEATQTLSQIEDQRSWKPLNVAEDDSDFYEQQNRALPSQYAAALANQESKGKLKDSFSKSSPADQSSNFNTGSKAQFAIRPSSCTQTTQTDKNPNTSQSSTFSPQSISPYEQASYSDDSLNEQIENTAFSERQQRLQILRSLLAEYLALTLQNPPLATTSKQHKFRASTTPSPNSFNSNFFSGDQQPIIPPTQTRNSDAPRKPHLAYGAPYSYPKQPILDSFRTKK